MKRRKEEHTERMARGVASWMCLLGGVALGGLVVLVPAMLDLQRRELQRDVLSRQAEHYQEQSTAYRTLATALTEAQPEAVEFMAYHQLGLKPVGSRSMGRYAMVGGTGGDVRRPLGPPGMSVEAWLAKPPPQATLHDLTPRLARTRVARLATGTTRLGLIALAGVSIALSLVLASPRPSE